MAFEKIGAQLVVEGEQSFFRTLGNANTEFSTVSNAATDAGRGFAAFARATEQTEEQIDSLTKRLDLQQRQYDLLKKDVDDASKKYGEGSQQVAKKQLALDKLSLSIEQNEKNLRVLNTQLEAEQQELGQSATAADAVAGSHQKIDDSLRTTGGSFDSFREIATGALRAVGEAALNLAVEGARAITGFVTDSVIAAGDFQAGMNNFQAVTNIDTSGLEEFRDLFLDLGAELPVSTAEVQEAATNLAKGGIEPATIAAGGLESALKFAGAAGLDLGTAADIAAKITGGWADVNATAAEKATLMAEAMDLLTRTANASTVDVDELSLGLFNVQGQAQNAGISLEETVITLGAVSSSFNSSAEAGNSFKNFIARLQPATGPAAKAMEELGLYGFDAQRALDFLVKEGVVPASAKLSDMGDPLEEIDGLFRNYITSTTGLKQGTDDFDKALNELNGTFANSAFYDAEGQFIGMAEASELLAEKTKNLTDEDKARLLQTIFGNDAMGVAARLSLLGAEGYDAMAAAIENQAGVQATATIKQQGFNVALDNFKGSVEALQITIGTYFLPILESLFNDYLSPGINTIRDFTTAMFESGNPFAYVVEQINLAVPGFSTFVSVVQGVVSFFSDNFGPIMAGALGALATALYTVVIPAFVTWAGAALSAAAGTIAALSPVLVPIAAIGLAVGALYAAWDSNFLGIRDAVTSFWNGTGQPIFNTLKTWLAETLTSALSTLAGFWTNTLKPALNTVWTFISTNVIPILQDLGGRVIDGLKIAVGALATLWTDTLKPAINAVWSFLDEYIIPLFKAIAEVHIEAMKLALTALQGVWQNVLLPALTAVRNYLADTLSPTFDAISNTVVPAVKTALEAVSNWWTATGSPIFGGIASFFRDTLGAAIGTVGDAIGGVIDWLNTLAEKLRNIELPSWMTPGSPTPWENGLRGVNAAMQELATATMPKLEAELAMMIAPKVVDGYTPSNLIGGQMVTQTNSTANNYNLQVMTNNSPNVVTQSYAMLRLLGGG